MAAPIFFELPVGSTLLAPALPYAIAGSGHTTSMPV